MSHFSRQVGIFDKKGGPHMITYQRLTPSLACKLGSGRDQFLDFCNGPKMDTTLGPLLKLMSCEILIVKQSGMIDLLKVGSFGRTTILDCCLFNLPDTKRSSR